MTDTRIALNLMFASDDNPAIVSTRVGEVVAAEVAAPLIGMHWSTFNLGEPDDDEPDWEALAKEREAERDEARQWARHGYEIGQKHCGWSDHGVAPAWLTEGWPPHIDSCEHLTQMAAFDEALTRVRAVLDDPSAIDWRQRVRAAIEGPAKEEG